MAAEVSVRFNNDGFRCLSKKALGLRVSVAMLAGEQLNPKRTVLKIRS
jgi:hypothetical protein